ncbi:MAG TPA: hypothetical protein VF579_03430 [Candidatus Methylomirabilis sp.]
MSLRLRAVIMVLIAATLLGSMGAWGRLIFRYEPDPKRIPSISCG